MSVLSSVIFLFYNLIYVAKPSEFPPKIRIFGPPNFEKRFIKNPAVNVDTEERQNGAQTRKKRDIEGLADWSRLLETTDNCDFNDKYPYEIFLT